MISASLACGGATQDKVVFADDFTRGLADNWHAVSFFGGKTEYTVVRDGTNAWLHADADKSCSALATKLNFKPHSKLTLRWRWRIRGVAANGSERDVSRFDHAGRVFVAFDTFIGIPRTLNYLWANTEKPGQFLPHPESGRTRLIIVESGNARAGRWVAEERDVTADWKRAFPGRTMPKIVGLGVLTDADSLKTHLTCDYADIELTAQ